MAVRLIGRVIVNAAIENLRDGAIFHTTFHQFLCNESGTGTAEVIIDGFTACGTVGSAAYRFFLLPEEGRIMRAAFIMQRRAQARSSSSSSRPHLRSDELPPPP